MNVRQIQTFLVSLGFTLDVDGVSGPATRAAISQFQLAHGLEADGVWGNATETAARELGFDGGPLPEPIHGIDVSAFCCDGRGRSLVRWEQLVPRPRFFYARSSFGMHKDGASDTHVKDGSTIGAVSGVYHFFESDCDPIAQAKVWFSAAGPQPAGHTLQPAIDFENNRVAPLSAAEALHWATAGRALILKAEELFQRPLCIYINPKTSWELRAHLDSFWSSRLLWLAEYTSACPIREASPCAPWKSVACHQWGGDVHVPGSTAPIDRNAIFGEEKLAALMS